MKKTLLAIAFLLIATAATWAQTAPNGFNYQGVARNAAGAPLSNTTISLRLTIHVGIATGTVVYHPLDYNRYSNLPFSRQQQVEESTIFFYHLRRVYSICIQYCT